MMRFSFRDNETVKQEIIYKAATLGMRSEVYADCIVLTSGDDKRIKDYITPKMADSLSKVYELMKIISDQAYKKIGEIE